MAGSTSTLHHSNKPERKNHVMASTDAEKVFNRLQHPFMIMFLSKIRLEKEHLQNSYS